MQIRKPEKFTEKETNHEAVLHEVYKVLHQHVSFGALGQDGTIQSDNIDGVFVDISDTGTLGSDFTVTHNLGRIPVAWWCVQQDDFGIYKLGTVLADERTLTLQCNIGNVSARFFVC